MLFLTGQRKGTIVLLVLLIGVLLIPRYVLPNRQHMFVFTPLEVGGDGLDSCSLACSGEADGNLRAPTAVGTERGGQRGAGCRAG